MARSESTKTHLENVAILPNSSHGDADGDVVLAVYAKDANPASPGTPVFKVDEDGDITGNSLTITDTMTIDSIAITSDDTTDGVVDMLTLTHSSSDNNATAADGIGVSFKLENATGTSTVEEWASVDVVSTTITNGSEDGDVVFSVMAGGAVTRALTIDSSDQTLSIGTNATDADGFNGIRIFPVTASKGSLLIQSTANTGDTVLTLTNAAQGGAYTYTIPNAGASCEFVMAAGTQTVAGAKNFTDIMSITQATGAQLTIKNDAAAYMTITQANAGGVTFASVSDGTPSFTFSQAMTLSSTLALSGNMTAGPATATAWTLTKTASAADTAGGAVTVTAGAGGTGATNGTNGAGVSLVGGASGAVTGDGRNGGAGGGITLTGTVGGNASTTGTGGAGGGITLTAGNGGTTATGTAGAAGAVAITAGNSGAGSGAATGVAGGAITLTSGNGGAITTGAGLAGGAITLVAGNGGNGSTAGGNGGVITLTPGSVGTGGTGVAGVVRLNGNAVKKGTVTDYDAQAATATIAALLGGIVTQNSQTGASTLTTPTGAEISAGIAGVATGDMFSVFYHNRGNQTSTITAGASGVTVTGGTVAITTTKTAILTFICTGADTWTCYVAAGA